MVPDRRTVEVAVTEETPEISSSASSKSESRPHRPPSEQRGRSRGRWRHSRKRDGESPESPLKTLDVAGLWNLSDQQLEERASGLGVPPPGRDQRAREELIHGMLKVHAEKHGLKLMNGILDLSRGGFGFLRSPEANYQPRSDDAYVTPQLIRQYGLQTGDLVTGMARTPRNRERYHTLLNVDLIWKELPEKFRQRKSYEDLTPLYPQERLVLETGPESISMRALDLLAPLGRGQRCLLVAPPRAGKTIILQQLAESIGKNYPEMNLLVMLLDERPEEVYNFCKIAKGEIISSTFDESIEHHVRVADLVMEKAHRMVENQQHVIVLLDSLTRLARACNHLSSSKGKLMSGGIEAGALIKPRKLFSAARNVEEGGSLTIVATVLVETGNRMDDLIFEEFKGTGNMEVHLSRDLQERRIYPAIHIEKSGTRREDLLYHTDELVRIHALRRQLSEYPSLDAMEKLIEQLRATKSNAELLMCLKL